MLVASSAGQIGSAAAGRPIAGADRCHGRAAPATCGDERAEREEQDHERERDREQLRAVEVAPVRVRDRLVDAGFAVLAHVEAGVPARRAVDGGDRRLDADWPAAGIGPHAQAGSRSGRSARRRRCSGRLGIRGAQVLLRPAGER